MCLKLSTLQRHGHGKNLLYCVIILCFYCALSTLHFIYTAPGKANAYLYWLQGMFDSPHEDMIKQVIRSQEENTPYVPIGFFVSKTSICPEKFPEMNGTMYVNLSEISLAKIESKYCGIVHTGGRWEPEDCIPKWNIAILIPFRNRLEHLPILLRHVLPMLLKQHLKFTIFVINQAGDKLFNRAMLLNVGFVEAMKRDSFDCFIFHDVDHIPENNRNYYGCTGMPRRLREKLNIYEYRLEYPTFFGGVSGVTTEQFMHVNGYSNQFWGWGGEDDDFYSRVTHFGYNISSPPSDYGRYTSIIHHHRQERQGLKRFGLLKHSEERIKVDGLNSLRYPPPTIEINCLFTNITVNISPVKDLVTD